MQPRAALNSCFSFHWLFKISLRASLLELTLSMLLPQPVIKCQYFITLRCCTDHSVAACNQCFKGIIIAELMMGFFLFFSLCCTLTLSLSATPFISLLSVSNFLRITRPSFEHGRWKTSLQTAPFTSRFSSLRTSSMSNLQVGSECEIKLLVMPLNESFECSYYYLITPGCRK